MKLRGQFEAYALAPGGEAIGPFKIGSEGMTFTWETLGRFTDRDGDKYERLRTNPSGTVYLVPLSEVERATAVLSSHLAKGIK